MTNLRDHLLVLGNLKVMVEAHGLLPSKVIMEVEDGLLLSKVVDGFLSHKLEVYKEIPMDGIIIIIIIMVEVGMVHLPHHLRILGIMEHQQ